MHHCCDLQTSHKKICLIAGKDFIQTLLLALGGQWQSVSDLTFALLVDVTKLVIICLPVVPF